MSTLVADALAGLTPGRSFGAIASRTARAGFDRYRFLLLLRFLLINGTGLALLAAVWMQGWVGRILAADDTHICKLIFALFVVGVVWTGQQV